MARGLTVRTAENEQKLLDALLVKPTFTYACAKARISREALNQWRREDPDFDDRLLAARKDGAWAIVDSLTTRGMKNDTTAAIFLVKSLLRETFGDRQSHDVTHRGNVRHDHTHDLSRLSDDELAQLRVLREKIDARVGG